MLEKIDTEEKIAGGRIGGESGVPTSAYFTAVKEERIECVESKQVRYNNSTTPVIGLNIPIERAVNKAEVEAFQSSKRAKVETEGGGSQAVGANLCL